MSFAERVFCAALPQLSFAQMCDALHEGYKEQGKSFTITVQTQSLIVSKWVNLTPREKIDLPDLPSLQQWLIVLPHFAEGNDKAQLITHTSNILFHMPKLPSVNILNGLLKNLPKFISSLDDNQKDVFLLAVDFLIEQHNAERNEHFPLKDIVQWLSYLLNELPENIERDWLCNALIANIPKQGIEDLPLIAEAIGKLKNMKPCPTIERFFTALLPQVKKHLWAGEKLDRKQHLPLLRWILKYAPKPETPSYTLAITLFPFLKGKIGKGMGESGTLQEEEKSTSPRDEIDLPEQTVEPAPSRHKSPGARKRYLSLRAPAAKIKEHKKEGSLT